MSSKKAGEAWLALADAPRTKELRAVFAKAFAELQEEAFLAGYKAGRDDAVEAAQGRAP